MPFVTSSNGASSSNELVAIGVGAKTSTLNASITPLGSGQTFTGTGELVLQADAMVVVQTDVAGTLFLDFSIDGGSNYSTFPASGFAVAGGINEFHVAVKGPRTFRVRYVNGSSAQTEFRLAVFYDNFGSPNVPIGQVISSDADALIVRSVSADLDLQRGKFQGMATGDKFGYASDLGPAIDFDTPATHVDLWAFGGQRNPPSGSFTPFFASDDAADTSISLDVTYQDANGLEQVASVSTDAGNGTTPVSLGVTATELYRAVVTDTQDLAGNVSFTSANNFTAGVPDNQNEVLAYIPAIDGKTQVLAARVPADEQFLLRNLDIGMTRASGAAGAAILAFQLRAPGGAFVTERPIAVVTTKRLDLRSIILAPLTDYRVRIRDVSDLNTTIDGTLNFYRVKV